MLIWMMVNDAAWFYWIVVNTFTIIIPKLPIMFDLLVKTTFM